MEILKKFDCLERPCLGLRWLKSVPLNVDKFLNARCLQDVSHMGPEEQMLPEKSKQSEGDETQEQPLVDMKGNLY